MINLKNYTVRELLSQLISEVNTYEFLTDKINEDGDTSSFFDHFSLEKNIYGIRCICSEILHMLSDK